MSDRRVLYCYPFTDVGNTYINKNVALWRALGYAVKKAPGELWRDRGVARARKTVVLNWYEDWMLGGRRPAVVSLAIALALLAYMRLAASNLIWVRHNFKPHDVDGLRWPHRLLGAALQRMSDTVVTHRPVASLASVVVPHSLVENPAPAAAERDIEFLCFGVVRKYKALDALLLAWPPQRALLIMGKSNDAELTARLQQIIASRGLKVRWENRFIPDAELSDALQRTRHVVLAHEDKSMIVSGAFYHAIACGANVLIRRGEFADYNAGLHPFVTAFDFATLPDQLQQLPYTPAQDVVREAQRHYGDDVCRLSWNAIF